MLIQIHMLQNYVPSLLNRDDSGAAKSAVFGGYPRGRVSSQCLKRSIRRSATFVEAFEDEGLLAKRTLLLAEMVDEALEGMGVDKAERQMIVGRLPDIGRKESSNTTSESDDEEEQQIKTKILVFLNQAEANIVAAKLLELYREVGAKKFADYDIKKLEKAIQHDTPRSVDVAMFGRMTTSSAFENVEASVQVAHALSTNTLTREYDYFTAVDDLSNTSGAAMIGDMEFNSSTYYKYFNIDWQGLVDNLGGDEAIASKAVIAFIEAAALAQPSGKQNSTAPQNLPDFVLVEMSERNIPVNYANAFIKPIRERHDVSLMDGSIAAFDGYAQRVRKAYGLNGQHAYFTLTDEHASLGEWASDVESLPALQRWVEERLSDG